MSSNSDPKPLNVSSNQPNPLDRINSYVSYIQTNHSGIEADVAYTATGQEILEMLRKAMYHAHSNGRVRERQLSNELSENPEK